MASIRRPGRSHICRWPKRLIWIGRPHGTSAIKHIALLGRRPLPEILDLMGHATSLIFLSLWYEGFPGTIVESFARATPGIASDLGSMKELVGSNRTGALVTLGNADHPARTAQDRHANYESLIAMRRQTREEFESKYNPERNHRLTLDIYHQALARRAGVEHDELLPAT